MNASDSINAFKKHNCFNKSNWMQPNMLYAEKTSSIAFFLHVFWLKHRAFFFQSSIFFAIDNYSKTSRRQKLFENKNRLLFLYAA